MPSFAAIEPAPGSGSTNRCDRAIKPNNSLTPEDGSLIFDSTGEGDRSTVLLPYIEQHGGEANDGGIIINWTTGDGPKGGDGGGGNSNHHPP